MSPRRLILGNFSLTSSGAVPRLRVGIFFNIFWVTFQQMPFAKIHVTIRTFKKFKQHSPISVGVTLKKSKQKHGKRITWGTEKSTLKSQIQYRTHNAHISDQLWELWCIQNQESIWYKFSTFFHLSILDESLIALQSWEVCCVCFGGQCRLVVWKLKEGQRILTEWWWLRPQPSFGANNTRLTHQDVSLGAAEHDQGADRVTSLAVGATCTINTTIYRYERLRTLDCWTNRQDTPCIISTMLLPNLMLIPTPMFPTTSSYPPAAQFPSQHSAISLIGN